MIKKSWPEWLNAGIFTSLTFLAAGILAGIYAILARISTASDFLNLYTLQLTLFQLIYFFLVGAALGSIFKKLNLR